MYVSTTRPCVSAKEPCTAKDAPIKLWVSFAGYRLFNRALLQKRPIIYRSYKPKPWESATALLQIHRVLLWTHTCIRLRLTMCTHTYLYMIRVLRVCFSLNIIDIPGHSPLCGAYNE